MDLLPRKRLRAAHGMEGHCVVFRRNLDLELRTGDADGMRLLAISVPVIYGSNIVEATIPSQQLCPLGFVEAKNAKNME